jgi:hypothetical protein
MSDDGASEPVFLRPLKPLELLATILDFELELRAHLIACLRKRHGNRWLRELDGYLPDGIKRTLGQITEVRKRFALRGNALRPEDVIDYLTFGNIIDVMRHDAAWSECLSGSLGPREEAIAGLTIIAATRNEIAHGRSLLVAELSETCRFYVNRMRRHIRYTPEELAEIEDSLGLRV